MSSRSRVESPRNVGISGVKSNSFTNARTRKKRLRGLTIWLERKAQCHHLLLESP